MSDVAKRGVAVDISRSVAYLNRSTLTQHTVDEVQRDYGYRPSSVSVDRLAFARSFRPTWATVLACVLGITGVGLFLLLVRSTETFSVSIREDHTGTTARIHGRVHPELLQRLEILVASRPGAPVGAPPANSIFAVASVPAPLPPPPHEFQPRIAPGSYAPPSAPVADPRMAPPPVAPGPASPWLLPQAPPSPGGVAAPYEHTVAPPARSAPPAAATPPPFTFPVLRLDDGRTVPVRSFILLGRNPERAASDPEAQLVVLDDQSISKTHAAIDLDATGMWLVDRHSTNGSAVIAATGEVTEVIPGTPVRLEPGNWVRLGARTLGVESSA